MKNLAVIIVAGGRGNRMGGSFPKQFMPLGGRPMLMHTIERFYETFPRSRIIVALHKDYVDYWQELCREHLFTIHHSACCGGDTRFHTVSNALQLIGDADLVAVHDAVRPLVDQELIVRAVSDGKAFGAVVPVILPVDSMRKVTAIGNKIVERDRYRMVQTPQVFKASLITEAYKQPYEARFTDDATVVDAIGEKIYMCEGSTSNIKITTPEDMVVAEALYLHKLSQTEKEPAI